MIRKFLEAVEQNKKVTLWGSGNPKREFLHSADLAKAIDFLLERYDADDHINVGTGEEITIKDLASLIADLTGYTNEIIWDQSKPDGTPRKVMDESRIRSLGWEPTISLREGIASTLKWYRENK